MSIPQEVIQRIADNANDYARGLADKYTQGKIRVDVTVSKHLIERTMQRGVPHSTVAKVLQRLFQSHLCELLYCMETKDLTYLNWDSNIHSLVIPCRTRKREDGSYSIAFTTMFEGIHKSRDSYHNILLRH